MIEDEDQIQVRSHSSSGGSAEAMEQFDHEIGLKQQNSNEEENSSETK